MKQLLKAIFYRIVTDRYLMDEYLYCHIMVESHFLPSWEEEDKVRHHLDRCLIPEMKRRRIYPA